MEQKSSSRKYVLSLVSLGLITGAWGLTGYSEVLTTTFSDLITGIMGILMLYFGGNVSNKFVVGKYLVEKAKAVSQTGDGR